MYTQQYTYDTTLTTLALYIYDVDGVDSMIIKLSAQVRYDKTLK